MNQFHQPLPTMSSMNKIRDFFESLFLLGLSASSAPTHTKRGARQRGVIKQEVCSRVVGIVDASFATAGVGSGMPDLLPRSSFQGDALCFPPMSFTISSPLCPQPSHPIPSSSPLFIHAPQMDDGGGMPCTYYLVVV